MEESSDACSKSPLSASLSYTKTGVESYSSMESTNGAAAGRKRPFEKVLPSDEINITPSIDQLSLSTSADNPSPNKKIKVAFENSNSSENHLTVSSAPEDKKEPRPDLLKDPIENGGEPEKTLAISDAPSDSHSASEMISSTPVTQKSLDGEQVLLSHPFYEPGFQEAFRQAQKLVGRVATIFATLPDPEDSAVRTLEAEALQLSQYELPVKRFIGLVGQSGSGKSSLINSLLNTNGLAITGDLGSAVTAFPIEYRRRKADSTSAFIISASSLTSNEISGHLNELLEDFRRPFLLESNEMTAEDFKSAENRSEVAKAIFKASFGSNSDFDITRLSYNDENDKPNSLAALQKWANVLDWPAEMRRSGQWHAETNEISECRQLIKHFTDKGLWPFLKVMSVGLDAPILRNGLVLVDLPGYHDVNDARVKAARNYQAKCDEIFVVAEIKRVVDNPIVMDIVNDRKEVASNVGSVTLPRVSIICTHSAAIAESSSEIEKLVNPEQLVAADNRIKDVKAQKFLNGGEAGEALDAAKLQRKSLLIEARNNQVMNDLERAYAADFPDKRLPVFCVDNDLYLNENLACALKISGIPKVRRHCLELMSMSLFGAVERFVSSTIPAFYNSVQIWVESITNDSAERRLQSLKIGDPNHLRQDFKLHVNQWAESLRNRIFTSLGSMSEQNISFTTANAAATTETWDQMHHCSHRSWMGKQGINRTPTVGHKNWNMELVLNLNKILAKEWMSMDHFIQHEKNDLSKKIAGPPILFPGKALKFKAPAPLIESLAIHERNIANMVEETVGKLTSELGCIKLKATTGNLTSYVVTLMQPVYQKGQSDRGKGVTNRNKDRLRDWVSRPEFVTEYAELVLEDLEKEVVSAVTRLSEGLDSVVLNVQRDLESLQTFNTERAVMFEQQPEFRRGIQAWLEKAEREIRSWDKVVKAGLEKMNIVKREDISP